MDNIIKFPNTTEKEYVNGTKLAREAFTKMKATEENLNWRLNFNDWKEYKLSEADVEQVALFGEHMKFTPIVASRLASKLAEVLCMVRNYNPYDELI
jgi:hypothetical protein